MRYIIRRIIVGVGIAIAMLLITKTFSLRVHAASTFNVNPAELRLTYTNTNGNTNTATYTSLDSITPTWYPYNTFYGKNSSGNGYAFRQLLFRLETSSSAKSGYYDLNYIFYNESMLTPLMNGYSFSIRNNNRVYTCSSPDPSNVSPYVFNNAVTTSTFKYILAVKCENVYLDLENNNVVYVMIQPSQADNYAGAYGISTTTFQVNSSSSIQNSIDENTQAQQETTDAVNDVNDTLNDDDTSDAQSSASGFFSGFSSTDHGGLSGIITAPMRFIQSLTSQSQSCRPLQIPLPFMNRVASLPCLSVVILHADASDFLQAYRVITTGLIAYWVIVKIFAHIRSFKKPDEDRVEVLEL